VKEVYGSGAEGIEYAGSLQVGGIVGIVCFVLLEILTPETRRRDGTLCTVAVTIQLVCKWTDRHRHESNPPERNNKVMLGLP